MGSTIAIPHEETEQKTIFQWAAWISGTLPDVQMLYAVPNGGKRPIQVARTMKATGQKPGVPDMCLPVARGGYHGLYIELKRIKGGKVSRDQAEWIQALTAQGYLAKVCLGSDQAIQLITDYLAGKITNGRA